MQFLAFSAHNCISRHFYRPNLPHYPIGFLEHPIHYETSSIEKWENNGDCSCVLANIEVIVSVIDGQGGGEEEEKNKPLHYIDVIFAVRFHDAQHRETQEDQQTVNELENVAESTHSFRRVS